MSWLHGIRHRLYVFIRGDAYHEEVRRELRFHRELNALAESGNTLGNETYYREEVRRMTLQIWIDRVRQDAAYAFRSLKRAPGFSIAVAVTLGLGVGVNGAMFALLDRVFLQPPDGVARPREIRRLYLEFENGVGRSRIVTASTRYLQFRALRQALDSTVFVSAYTMPDSIDLRDGSARIHARRSFVTADFFKVLGVRMTIGRAFVGSENDIAVPTPVAVLSDAFWRREYAADPSVLGRRVMIGSTPYTVIGVAQPEFTGIDLDAADLWSPANNAGSDHGGQPGPWYEMVSTSFNMIARPANGAAEDRLLTVATNAIRPVRVRYFVYDPNIRVLSGPIIEALGPVQRKNEVIVATRVAGVAAVVLFIACANVTNLLLLRAARRRREIAVRRALGASRARLIQQLTVESLLLALLGAGLATGFAVWASIALRRLFLPGVHWATGVVEPRLLAVVFLISLVIGLVAGLTSGFQAMRRDLAESLKAGTRNGAYRESRLRATLLALQMALCAMLIVGAGLFIRSLDNVRSISIGYDPTSAFFASPMFDDPGAHRTEVGAALPEAARRLRATDGVQAVAYASIAPLRGFTFASIYFPGFDSIPSLSGRMLPSLMSVSPGFFAASGLPLRAGRDLTEADQLGAPGVVVVSETMARRAWPNESPIGKCFMIGDRDGPCYTVVGVAADAHRTAIIEESAAQFYVSIAQYKFMPSVLVVRTRPGRGNGVIRATEQILKPMVGGMIGLRVRTFESVLEPELRPWRLGASLFTALGALALVVAGIGVYSVVAYGVSQRLQEMGIRIALGARTGDIVDLVLADGLRAVVVGLALGIAGSLALGRVVGSLLFGVVPADPSVLIITATILAAVGAAACIAPAWRAAKVDPVVALRME